MRSLLSCLSMLALAGCSPTPGASPAPTPSAPAQETPSRHAGPSGANAPCEQMPAERPTGAHLRYSRRGGDPLSLRRVRLIATGEACPPDEIPGHLRPVLPPPSCVELDAPRLDALWVELSQGGLGRIRRRSIQASPHRGGQSIGAFWPGGRCSVSDTRTSEVLPRDMPSFRRLAHQVSQALRTAQRRAAQSLRAVALISVRTSSRSPLVRMRFDNSRAEMKRVRLLSVSAADHPDDALPLRELRVAGVPFAEVYPSTEIETSSLNQWIEVPSRSSRMLELEPEDHPRYSFGLRHRYLVRFEREGGSSETLELVLDDGSRRPVNR